MILQWPTSLRWHSQLDLLQLWFLWHRKNPSTLCTGLSLLWDICVCKAFSKLITMGRSLQRNLIQKTRGQLTADMLSWAVGVATVKAKSSGGGKLSRGCWLQRTCYVFGSIYCATKPLWTDAMPLLNHLSFLMTTLPEKQQMLGPSCVLANARPIGGSQENQERWLLIIATLS